MTRNEFFDEVTSWGELIEFCLNNGCNGYVEDVYSDDGRDDYINENLVDWAQEESWRDLRDRLDDIETDYDYYEYDYGDWRGLDDDDLQDRMEEVAEWCDRNGIWEDDEEEPVDEEDPIDEEDDSAEDAEPNSETDTEDQTPVEDEDCPLDEFLFAGIGCVKSITEGESMNAAEQERELDLLLSAV